MKHLLAAAGIALVTACTAAEAEGGELKDVKWGMTAAEVITTLDDRPRATDGAFEVNGVVGAVSDETFNDQKTAVKFHFDDDGKLVAYRIEFTDGYQACEVRRSEFEAVYGAPFHKSGGPGTGWTTTVWYEPGRAGQIELMSIGEESDADCRVTFMDEMARNARDAQGLTRNEGEPTPRPDYQPYRPQ